MTNSHVIIKVMPTLTQIIGSFALSFVGGYLGGMTFAAAEKQQKEFAEKKAKGFKDFY